MHTYIHTYIHKALDDIAGALRIRPKYKAALFELGLTLLDAGRPAVAVHAFEKLLRLDRYIFVCIYIYISMHVCIVYIYIYIYIYCMCVCCRCTCF